jgi:G protein-coupled receptor 103
MVSIVIYIENTSEAFTSSEIKEIYSFFVAIRVFIVSPFFITAVNLALLAIERYNALIHPMKIHRRLTKRAVKIVICLIWILAMLFSAPVQVGSEKSWYFLLGTIVTSVAISLFIIVSCYGKIIYGIYISKTIFNDASSATNAQDVKDKKNIVKMLITNTLLFGVTRLPNLGYALRLLCLKDRSYGCLMYISLLGHVSAFCHPLMFILFSQNYRSAVKKMFTSCTNRGNRES